MTLIDVTLDTTTVHVTCTDQGRGRPVLLLHGGGGPLTVSAWAHRLAAAADVRVIVPTHPGFEGTPRPETLSSPRDLARLYAGLLESLDLNDVTVVGNSLGGWIAAELGLLDTTRVGRQVLVDAVGIEVPGHPVADFFALTPQQVAQRSYADPATFGLDPATLPAERLAAMAGNRATLQVYGGTAMTDPTLAGRLAATVRPTLVVWGEADRIGDPDYGRAYAAALPGAGFVLLPGAGHLPQIETPDVLVDVVREFLQETPRASFSGSMAK
ncbi:alpha/beta fold hydrolase [Kineococcus sp. GCM10028916]|uniref:alpha/beta fold hydrolase n=1 Tax=Kineococcus sp. GCM10028916 TaxID=3273394 RepID=UPI00362A775F